MPTCHAIESAARYQHLYISPHSDDAVLSCGGRIHTSSLAGERSLVVTLFAATPPKMAYSDFAEGQHQKWELDAHEAMEARRAEDLAALRVLGADGLYLDYYDCIYRLHPETGEAMYASEEGIFGDVDPAEDAFHLQLADRLAALLGAPSSAPQVHAPLTVGHHVDHLIARDAAGELMRRGYRVDLYEDYPYAKLDEARESALASWSGAPLRPLLIPLAPEAMDARVAGIAEYRSQISTLFGDLETMEGQTRAYCELLAQDDVCVERYWTVERE